MKPRDAGRRSVRVESPELLASVGYALVPDEFRLTFVLDPSEWDGPWPVLRRYTPMRAHYARVSERRMRLEAVSIWLPSWAVDLVDALAGGARVGMQVAAVLWNWKGSAPGFSLYVAQLDTGSRAARSVGSPVKVGVSRDVQARVAGLRQGLPWELNLVATVPGVGRAGEQELHRVLRNVIEFPLRGEWYSGDVLQVFRTLPAEGPIGADLVRWEP